MATTNIIDAFDIFESINEDSFTAEWLGRALPLIGEKNADLISTAGFLEAIESFNMALFTLAACFLGWNVASGFIDAARDGRPFAEKAHIVWGPMRAVTGLGLVAPIPGMAWNLGQALVIGLAVMGTSFANAVWVSAIEGVFESSATGQSGTMDTFMKDVSIENSQNFINDVLHREACRQYIRDQLATNKKVAKQYAEKIETSIGELAVAEPPTAQKMTRASEGAWTDAGAEALGPKYSHAWRWDYGDACGSIIIPIRKVESKEAWSGYADSWWTVWSEAPSDQRYQKAKKQMQEKRKFSQAQYAALQDVIDQIRGNEAVQFTVPISQETIQKKDTPFMNKIQQGIVDGKEGATTLELPVDARQYVMRLASSSDTPKTKKEIFVRHMQAVRRNYEAAMTEAAKGYQSGIAQGAAQQLIDRNQRLGWLNAGGVFRVITQLNSQTKQIADRKIHTTALDIGNLPSDYSGKFAAAIETAKEQVENYKEDAQPLNYNALMRADKVLDGSTSIGERAYSGLAADIKDAAKFSNTSNPYGSMIDFGYDSIETGVKYGSIGVALMGGSTIAGKVTKKFGKVGKGIMKAISGGSRAAGYGLAFFGAAMIAIGGMHAYVLPLYWYAFWIFGVLAFLSSVLVAFFGVPFWSLASQKLEGEELLHQNQKMGVWLLFKLVMTPPLMVLGLIAGFSVSIMAVAFLNQSFEPAVAVASNGEVGILIATISLVFLTWVHWKVITMSAALISQLPSRIGEFFGLSDNDDAGENSGNQAVSAGMGFIAGQVPSAVMGTTGKAAGAAKAAGQPKPTDNNDDSSDSGGSSGGSAGPGNRRY